VIDWRVAAEVFTVIFVAELPDKTALASLVLATRMRPGPVALGSALALTVQSLVAVTAGSLLSLLPARAVHVGAGVLFVASAAVMWRRQDEEEVSDDKSDEKRSFWRTFATSFGVVFIAEWGDLTQFGTAGLAARHRMPVTVFCAATLALWCVVALAVFVGHRAGKLLDPERTKKIAAVIFAAVGLALIAGWL
jgi:putative Ca2+/H+ antiporter (TMEM165/GDT1 family)